MISNMISKLIWLMGPFIDYVATNHRSLAMILVVLPLSFILRNVLAFRYDVVSHRREIDLKKIHNNKSTKTYTVILCTVVCLQAQKDMMLVLLELLKWSAIDTSYPKVTRIENRCVPPERLGRISRRDSASIRRTVHKYLWVTFAIF